MSPVRSTRCVAVLWAGIMTATAADRGTPILWKSVPVPEPLLASHEHKGQTLRYGGDVRIGDLAGDGRADFVVFRSTGNAMKPCFLAAFASGASGAAAQQERSLRGRASLPLWVSTLQSDEPTMSVSRPQATQTCGFLPTLAEPQGVFGRRRGRRLRRWPSRTLCGRQPAWPSQKATGVTGVDLAIFIVVSPDGPARTNMLVLESIAFATAAVVLIALVAWRRRQPS